MSRTSPQPHPIASRLLALRNDITLYVAKACRRRAHSSDAPRDLAQETVVRGIESIDNFNRPEEALRPWMLGIANHVVRDDERASYRYAVLGVSALLLACFVFVRREERASPPPVLELAVSDFGIHGISIEPLPVPEKQAQEPTAAVVEPVQTVQKPKLKTPRPSLPKHEESSTKALDIALAGVDRSPVQLQ